MEYRAYGYGDEPREEDGAVCPLCGDGCEKAYYRLGEYIGCDMCVEERAAEYAEELFARPRAGGRAEGGRRYGEM